jgi:hypothetical protein
MQWYARWERRFTFPLSVWNDLLTLDFSREEILALIDGSDGIRLQPEEFNTELKLSFYVESEDPEQTVRKLTRQKKEKGNGLNQIIWSSGKDLDIIPAAAGKERRSVFSSMLRTYKAKRLLSPETAATTRPCLNSSARASSFPMPRGS